MSEQLPGVAEQLDPLVARVLAPNPSPFTFTGTQTYLVGTTDVAVIDPGPADPSHIDALLRAIDGRPLTAIVLTHTHRDHSPGSRPLKAATGAPIVGCAPLVLEDSGPRSDASFDADYAPDHVMADDESLAGDGWTLTAVATPGHTSNHLCFALTEAGALFTGDHVMGWAPTVVSPPDGDMAAYMASLDKLMQREDKVYYPAHGEPVPNPRRLVRGMLGHRKQREGQIMRLLRDAPRAIPAMVAAMYVGIDPRLFPAAGRSVLAHLIDLRARGLVAQRGDDWRAL
jgi:glyoxylase-like metal-dependent hydrolase (beta-lactamase superfamily II)